MIALILSAWVAWSPTVASPTVCDQFTPCKEWRQAKTQDNFWCRDTSPSIYLRCKPRNWPWFLASASYLSAPGRLARAMTICAENGAWKEVHPPPQVLANGVPVASDSHTFRWGYPYEWRDCIAVQEKWVLQFKKRDAEVARHATEVLSDEKKLVTSEALPSSSVRSTRLPQ